MIGSLHPTDRRLAALSAYIRLQNQLGTEPGLTTENWEAFATAHLSTPVSAKLRRLLEFVADATLGRPAEKIPIPADQVYPLLDAADSAEVGYLAALLVERGDLREVNGGRHVITGKGWERLEPIGHGVPKTCFVAMSFHQELNSAYDSGIHPAVHEDCGIDVIRVDRVEHADNINDKIIADIRRAQFMVADFTKHPNGVYFEAGFALGMGKLVIWTCKSDDFDATKVHFDTRPYNHIVWENEGQLREKLTNRIRALVPNAKMA